MPHPAALPSASRPVTRWRSIVASLPVIESAGPEMSRCEKVTWSELSILKPPRPSKTILGTSETLAAVMVRYDWSVIVATGW